MYHIDYKKELIIMNKGELIDAVIEVKPKDFKSHAAAARTVDAVFSVIMSRVAAGESVAIQGFGTFLSVEREARVCRNPQTGENVEVPAHLTPKFKPSKSFKDALLK